MKFKWTVKDLKELSDDKIIRGIISERMSDLPPYSPLKRKLEKIYNKYDEKINKEERGKGVR